MFQGLADRWKSEASFSLRGIAMAVAAGLAAAGAIGFLVAAFFVRIAQLYGAVAACLACAGVFIFVALILTAAKAVQSARHRRIQEAKRAAAAAAAPSPLADPRLIMVGFQIAQAIGFKRLLPLLALGGVAFAFASRRKRDGDDS